MDRLEEALVAHCAPTLAALKPASLFSFRPTSPESSKSLEAAIYSPDQPLAPCGIRILSLKQFPDSGAHLLYVYREAAIRNIVEDPAVRQFLLSSGYPATAGCRSLLRHLSRRLCSTAEFPHEIGVFLGYPLQDVQGFIKHRGKSYQYSGCWKVYHDAEAAKRRFEQFDLCTRIYCERFQRGCPLSQLALPVKSPRYYH